MKQKGDLIQNIGTFIAQRRILSDMTQEELAKGVCSVTYLSKIENNKIQPNIETINLLCKRLKINLYNEIKKRETSKKLIAEWYQAIKSGEQVEVDRIEKKITELKNLNDTNNFYYLIRLRYYIFKKEMSAAKLILSEIERYKDKLIPYHTMLFYYFCGLFYCLQSKYMKSIKYFKRAELLCIENNLVEPELDYHLALTYTNMYNPTLAIHYVKEAITYYQNNLHFRRCIESYLILGINYTRIKQYLKAHSLYEKALSLAIKFDLQLLIGETYHNMGFLYASEGNHLKAIEYYKDSLHYKSQEHYTYINTIIYLVTEHIYLGDLREAKLWIDKGLKTYKTNPFSKTYYVKIKLLEYEINDDRNFLLYLEKEAIPFFTSIGALNNLSECYVKAAEIYANIFQYKKSSYYYKLAYEVIDKIVKGGE